MSDCALAHSDAAYVLGSLSAAERLEYERHLPDCETCRESVAVLAGLPGLLGRVPREQVEVPLPIEPLPETVLPALVAAVRREQRRRSLLVTVGVAAAVAAVTFGATALQGARDDGREPVAAPTSISPSAEPYQDMDVVLDWGMQAQVSLTPTPSGTSVLVNCTYASRAGMENHMYHYRLVVFTRDGRSAQLMDWWAGPGQPRYGMPTTTGTQLADMKRLEVQDDEGATILELKL